MSKTIYIPKSWVGHDKWASNDMSQKQGNNKTQLWLWQNHANKTKTVTKQRFLTQITNFTESEMKTHKAQVKTKANFQRTRQNPKLTSAEMLKP